MLKLRDEQWERIREHFPEENVPDDRPGRKPIATRRVLEAVLWILNTGAQWHMLPQGYPNYKTVHRRFQQWCREETLRKVLTDLANTLRDGGEIDESEYFIDACFASGKGGGEEIGPTRRGKVERRWHYTGGKGLTAQERRPDGIKQGCSEELPVRDHALRLLP